MGQPGPPSLPTRREPVPGWRSWETGFETLSDPTSNPATWLTCHPATTSTRVASTPLRGPKMPLTAAKPPRPAPPHFNRLFRGLMSLRRRSHGPADVMPHVWQCHCRPERTLSKSVHCFRPVGGRFTPVSACRRPEMHSWYKTPTPVHPQYCADALRFGGPHRGAHLCGVL